MSSVAGATDHAALLAEDGWELAAEGSTKQFGTVPLEVKVVDGERCLRGTVRSSAPAEVLLEVITDVAAADRFTREALIASRVLGTDGDVVHYYQHLDVPGWTMAADRFWVLAGQRLASGDDIVYVWERFDWRGRYPELAAELARDHPSAIEPIPNFGAWQFRPIEGGTQARYILCSDPGGSMPGWLVRAGATKSFPNTISDVVVEAQKRASSR